MCAARPVPARLGKAGRAWHGAAGPGGARHGEAWRGKAGLARPGLARLGGFRLGGSFKACLGIARQARLGAARRGRARQAWLGMAGRGGARHGRARRGSAGHGGARQGRRGLLKARSCSVGFCSAWLCMTRQAWRGCSCDVRRCLMQRGRSMQVQVWQGGRGSLRFVLVASLRVRSISARCRSSVRDIAG